MTLLLTSSGSLVLCRAVRFGFSHLFLLSFLILFILACFWFRCKCNPLSTRFQHAQLRKSQEKTLVIERNKTSRKIGWWFKKESKPDQLAASGWLGRLLSAASLPSAASLGNHVGPNRPRAFGASLHFYLYYSVFFLSRFDIVNNNNSWDYFLLLNRLQFWCVD